MAAGTPVFRLAGTQAAAVGAITVVWPTHAPNDVALLIVETSNQPATLTTAAGFVEVGSARGTGTAAAVNAVYIRTYWNRATSSAMTNPVVADSGSHQLGRIVTFTNVAVTGTPFAQIIGSVQATAATGVSIPTGTNTATDSLIVICVNNG